MRVGIDSISVTYHHGAKTRLTPSWHDKNVIAPNSKIYYVTDGAIRITLADKIIEAKKGDAVIIPAGTRHDYSLCGVDTAEKYWFHFDLRRGTSGFFEGLSIPYITHIGTEAHIAALFEKAIANGQGESLKARLECTAAVTSIISLYLDFCGYVEMSERASDEIDAVIKHIKKSYHEKFTLDALSKMARLAPNYFAKKFKERTGHPPLKYVNVLKMERAKFLLEHTDMPISAVMEAVGLLDAAHFSKLFRAHTGYSPKKFRESFKKV